MSDGKKKGLLVRVDKEQFDFINHLAGRGKVNQLMVKLIDMLMKMNRRDRDDFLSGTGPIHKTAEIVERLQFANNAFERKRWAWAIEEFQRLSAGAPAVDGVFRFSQYKLGYCWAEIAAELRLHAFEELQKGTHANSVWETSFDSADWALCAALFYNARYSNVLKDDVPDTSTGQTHAVVIYNLACVWALRAQYATERRLSQARRKSLLKEVLRNKRHKGSGGEVSIGSAEQKDERAGAFVEHAFTHLRRLSLTAKFDQPPFDVGFLVRNALIDQDLAFVRGTKDFDVWTKATAPDSILHTFERLKSDVREMERELITEIKEASVHERSTR